MASSEISEDFVPGRKLLVHVAENGHSFEFDCDESTPVEMFLLCLDRKLEPHRPLSFYKLPQDDREVFLYNRPRLHADAQPPPAETFDLPPPADPPPPPSAARDPHPLDDAPDPALKALPSYERQFRFHFHRGQGIFNLSQTKFDACQRLLLEQWVQQRAMETARGSMDQGYRVVQQSFSEFVKLYSQQHRHHSELLQNFASNIERLRSCRLHPALQTESRKCLLDFVKEDHLRKLAENCAHSHRQFEVKVSQFKSAFGELKRRVEDLGLGRASASLKDLDAAIKDHQKYLAEQKSIMQSLSKDVNTVKKLVDDCLSRQISSSLRPHDAVSALGPMYDVHEKNNLPKMRACDDAIGELLNLCKAKKNDMNLFVHSFMQKVVQVQSVIRDIRLQFPAFMEAMDRQDDVFADLSVVRGIAPAYRACLAEVIRRKSSMKLYMGKAGEYAERLARERELEIGRRSEFLRAQGRFIPRDILATMGLFDNPKPCDVNVAPFDTNLLEIDFAELNRYAPEHLAAPLARKGSSLSEMEGNADALTETGEESVHISGTGKLEVENAQLRADLASAIARICSLSQELGDDPLDDSKVGGFLKDAAEKTAEALRLKDEYSNHLQSMLKMKELQCSSYEKRIQELEQRLSDHYLQAQRAPAGKDASSGSAHRELKVDDDCKSGVSGDGEVHMPYTAETSTEAMEEASSASASAESKLKEHCTEQSGKPREGADENMVDFPGELIPPVLDPGKNLVDASMVEQPREENTGCEKDGGPKMEAGNSLLSLDNSMNGGGGGPDGPPRALTSSGSGSSRSALMSKSGDMFVSELQSALAERSSRCDDIESQLKTAVDEILSLQQDLEVSRKLLEESQMNCAHLENCLHEARQEAQTNLCAADRRASEYNALRSSAVNCVTASGGVAGFVDSLRSLSLSLTSSPKEEEDDGLAEFRACIRVLADKVNFLSRQRTELLDRCSVLEATDGKLSKEVEEKKEQIKNLYAKLRLEKQASKEKISFGRLEVHELAAFVLNAAGHYVAVNRSHPNYYLSTESVALFVDHLPTRPAYITGQIVHIERQTVRPAAAGGSDQAEPISGGPAAAGRLVASPTNPYDLPVGCEYFIVTVAMLPDAIRPLTS
ncbi:unnamed protein product [Spirodela intermedia]|uniref:Uncharacterized protein n=1 Tax=Spirodela intermedia TaxID=51605 RepID=A0A7I8IWT9_SPIIN|nr:unnamed protein product [Spirodela intermedia]CAA6662251.1 unnamed protein product [Spirodela intermedia]